MKNLIIGDKIFNSKYGHGVVISVNEFTEKCEVEFETDNFNELYSYILKSRNRILKSSFNSMRGCCERIIEIEKKEKEIEKQKKREAIKEEEEALLQSGLKECEQIHDGKKCGNLHDIKFHMCHKCYIVSRGEEWYRNSYK